MLREIITVIIIRLPGVLPFSIYVQGRSSLVLHVTMFTKDCFVWQFSCLNVTSVALHAKNEYISSRIKEDFLWFTFPDEYEDK